MVVPPNKNPSGSAPVDGYNNIYLFNGELRQSQKIRICAKKWCRFQRNFARKPAECLLTHGRSGDATGSLKWDSLHLGNLVSPGRQKLAVSLSYCVRVNLLLTNVRDLKKYAAREA